ncbi:hypothetical protein HK26_04125 [Acetobacter okinawensis]|uniref:Uncharacterized protein n=1 Tax=Acetobacter okinawensis TaxID=1076594 RepID=A0A252BY03_9PROT|nr:hypothetical protein HK26_04125 [Acetobacter okinawensis]
MAQLDRVEGEGLRGVIIGDDLRAKQNHQAAPLFLAYNAPELEEGSLLGIMGDIIRICSKRRRISEKVVAGNIIKIG